MTLPGYFHILVVTDCPERCHVLRSLRKHCRLVEPVVASECSRIAQLNQATCFVILDDGCLRANQVAVLQEIRRHNPSVLILVLCERTSQLKSLSVLEEGADCIFVKPITEKQLCEAIISLAPRSIPATNQRVGASVFIQSQQIVRAAGWICEVESLLQQVAASDVPVLIQGETGTGKEIVARYIHSQSARSSQKLLKLNCAALPSELIESELFGFERGAFTGAFESRPGKFELADGGTILLDEIGDMDLRLQAKLLQVLQDGEFHRIGAREAMQANVRIIAATHRELEQQIENGEFREDLYYRINVATIPIPPLRERREEIIPLARHFLAKHAREGAPIPELGAEFRTALLRHSWPGNIRELENMMRRYLVIGNPELLVAELIRTQKRAADTTARTNLGITISGFRTDAGLARPNSYARDMANSEWARLDHTRKTAEVEAITEALRISQWNRKRAAELLGIEYKALLYRMKKLGIE